MKTLPNDSVTGSKFNEENALTKREYFAAMAMQGLIAGADFTMAEDDLVIQSIRCADALIRVLNNTSNEKESV